MTQGVRTVGGGRGGFSLVEILVAIVVLGFGLLGLAAVFPVVVTQQRDAADTTFGPSAALAVDAQVFGRTGVIDWQDVRDMEFASAPGGSDFDRWVTERTRVNQNGELRIGATEVVPVTARLVPSPFGGSSPRYVWDVAVRRPDRDPDRIGWNAGPLEVAVFVRRIDAGIRVPTGRTLSGVLTGVGLSNQNQRALPVAVDPRSGRPSNNGVGDYAGLLTASNVQPEEGRRDVFDRLNRTRGLTMDARALLSRPGQMFVDSLGVVRTVTEIDNEGRVVVEPAFPNDERVQIVFSPQVPVEVRVVRIENE